MAPLASSYDVNSGDQAVLAVSLTETQTTDIKFGIVRRNSADERWKTLIGVVEITQELDGEMKSEYMSFNGGTFDADDYFIPADVSRDVARDGTTYVGSGTGQRFNRNANVRLVNFHTNFNQKLNTDRDDGMASGIKLWFASTANYIRAVGNDLFLKDGNNAEISLSTLAAAAGVDNKFRISNLDTTSGTFEEKIIEGDGLSLTKTNPGANETMTAAVNLKSNGGLMFEAGELKVDPAAVSVVPTGSVFAWLIDAAPTGYLLCYGQTVSRTTYSTLYALIGDTYGAGDGTTTFNLPDMRGRVLVGQDDMGGTAASRLTLVKGHDASTLGNTFGVEKHALSTGEMPSHSHGMNIRTGSGNNGNNNMSLDSSDISSTLADAGGRVTSNASGSNEEHENVQPSIVINYIIKT